MAPQNSSDFSFAYVFLAGGVLFCPCFVVVVVTVAKSYLVYLLLLALSLVLGMRVVVSVSLFDDLCWFCSSCSRPCHFGNVKRVVRVFVAIVVMPWFNLLLLLCLICSQLIAYLVLGGHMRFNTCWGFVWPCET